MYITWFNTSNKILSLKNYLERKKDKRKNFLIIIKTLSKFL